MFTASDFGVFDLLMESKKPLTSATIAERLGASPFGMEWLLDACVGLKFLQVERKDGQMLYGNTDLANRYLGKTSLKTQYYSLKFNAEFVYTRVQHLADSVREGETQTYRLSDISTKDFYEAMYRSESSLQEFMEFMHELWSLYGQDVLNAFDLSHFPLVCDVGGCSGDLAKQYISLYPNSTVTIFDLPEVVETGKNHFVSSEEHRITFHEGGGVLIVEIVLNEDRTGLLEAHIYHVVMLLLTEGKERTPSEYNALLSAAGFKEMQLKKGQLFDAILGRK